MSLLRWLVDVVTFPLRLLLAVPSRLVTGSRRLQGLSLPARMALLVAVFLVLCVVVTLFAFYHTQDRSFVKAKLTPLFASVITLLVVIIPIVVYKALKLWLEGDISPFPDIDYAWKSGLAALEQQGLELLQTPLFLILGSSGEKQEKALFDAARLNLSLREVPPGPAALHWYASPEGIYLVCTDAGCLSQLSNLAAKSLDKESAGSVQARPRPAGDAVRGTIVAGLPGPSRQSLVTSGPVPTPSSRPEVVPSANIRGTMVVGGTAPPGAADAGDFPVTAEKRVIKLEQQVAADQERRLEYVCHLVRRARQTLCPINGVLTLLPFGLIRRSIPESLEVQRAVKRDLAAALRVLRLRCPVTALVVGLEEESGFRELVRRVGRERAVAQRFGKGFSVGNPPTPERLEALCAHACGAFEDWVYVLFREKGAFSKPGNTKLYSLLCEIRRSVQSRLAKILVAGFGRDPEQDPGAETPLFSGCYFAAAGEADDRQAFVKGVFEKLVEQQEELEWTDDGYREEHKFQLLSRLGLGFDTLLVLTLAGLVLRRWFHGW